MTRTFNSSLLRAVGNSFGFTIVELLIVIVVVGVLAALVLNSFGNAQTNAKIVKEIAMARSYYNAFEAAIQDGQSLSSYPDACLGPPSFYPAGCSEWGQNNESVQPAVNALLTTYGAQEQQAGYWGGTPPGLMMYLHNWWNVPQVLGYELPGNTSCGIGHVLTNTGGNVWAQQGATDSGQSGIYTTCFIALN
jgi:prepilin-type N-terminal cleavage/methylation domain-containing protein